MSTCVPNRGECWPDSVICVGEGRVRRGGLGWRKGSRAGVEEGEKGWDGGRGENPVCDLCD